MRCEPGCNHSSHEKEEREDFAQVSKKLRAISEKLSDLAYEDVLYRYTRVGRLQQKADRLSRAHAPR